MTINNNEWREITDGYNRPVSLPTENFWKPKTNFSEKRMLMDVYDKAGGMRAAARILGMTVPPFRKRLIHHGIQIHPRGGERRSCLDGYPLKDKIAADVASEVGCSKSNVHTYASKNHITLGRAIKGEK